MTKRKIAFDVETHVIRPGMLFPKLVCASFAMIDFGTVRSWIRLGADAALEWLGYIKDPNVILIGHNACFDTGVMLAELILMARAGDIRVPSEEDLFTLVFDAYEQDRISDTMIRAMMKDIARGRYQVIEGGRRGKWYNLASLALRELGIVLQKKDTWRLHYAALDGLPLSQWPQEAIDYSLLDSEITIQVDAKITEWVIAEGMGTGEIPDEWRQMRAAWVLHLIAGWGVRVDPVLVAHIKDVLETQRKVNYAILDQWGVLKKDRHGNYKRTKTGGIQKDQKLLQKYIAEGFEGQGKTPPMTDGRKNKLGIRIPEVSHSADTARESGHPAAMAFADGASADKLLSTYVPILERGAAGLPITSSPNVLVASGRTSWQNPNWQNPPRLGGIRECVIPRKGFVLCAADLDTVELRALAQSCLEIVGYSEMAQALQRGEDLHLGLAAEILGLDYQTAEALYNAGDPVVTEARQTAKKGNFSLPGGVGVAKFAWMYLQDEQPLCLHPDGTYDQAGSERRAGEIKAAWFRKWTEMKAYLQNAGDICGDFGSATVEAPWSGRIRGGLDYCACANTYFQGRVADGTKLALWRLARACYVDKTSPLYGSRLVLFLHDEVILEVPENCASACAAEVVKILCGAVQEVIPSIPITSTAVLMRRWYKGAKPAKITINGREILVPCKPVKDAKGKTKWLADLPE